jgi:hypothetical protein
MTIFVSGVLRRLALGWRDEHLGGRAAASEASEPLHFDGWLELLRVLSELVGAAPSSGADPGTVPRPSAGREWPDPAGRPGRERLLDMGLDNHLVADTDSTRLNDGYTHLERRRSTTRTLGDG